ncbi:MAG TPA: tetratricopeptide repeat protein [Ktedonobacteraceae bacterium]|nr:tetratricopeptide repeat protein [Ktedonobacteraceae bacterium]
MPTSSNREIKIFYCYAREDKAFRDELEIHLKSLKHQYNLIHWHDHEIYPGEEWEIIVDRHLRTSHIILLLISPHFLASDYCYKHEMLHALERHQTGMCRVIPIILRPAYWEAAPFNKLQMLPRNTIPISRWQDRDEAFHHITQELNKTIKGFLDFLNTQPDWKLEGQKYFDNDMYSKALAAFENAINIEPNDISNYERKAAVLVEVKDYNEALNTYNQAIKINPNQALLFYEKGNMLNELQRYDEALEAYQQAIKIDPNELLGFLHTSKANTLIKLQRYEEALEACEEAIRICEDNDIFFLDKGDILSLLGRPEEALLAYNHATQLIQIECHKAPLHHRIAKIFFNSGKEAAALIECDKALSLKRVSHAMKETILFLKEDILIALNRHDEAHDTYIEREILSNNK